MILDRSFSFNFPRWNEYCVSKKDLKIGTRNSIRDNIKKKLYAFVTLSRFNVWSKWPCRYEADPKSYLLQDEEKKKKQDPGLEKPFSSRDSYRLTTTKIRNVFYLYQSFPEKLTKRYDWKIYNSKGFFLSGKLLLGCMLVLF